MLYHCLLQLPIRTSITGWVVGGHEEMRCFRFAQAAVTVTIFPRTFLNRCIPRRSEYIFFSWKGVYGAASRSQSGLKTLQVSVVGLLWKLRWSRTQYRRKNLSFQVRVLRFLGWYSARPNSGTATWNHPFLGMGFLKSTMLLLITKTRDYKTTYKHVPVAFEIF